MKRTKSINLERMRKEPLAPRLKPLVLSIAAFSLVGCDSKQANVFISSADCKSKNPGLADACELAYQRALEKSIRTSPKYRSLSDCRYDFGRRNCIPYASPEGYNWYMPEMSAFMFAADEDGDEYESEPVYSSSNYNSGYYGLWTTSDGRTYKKRSGPITVRGDTFKPKPTVTKTMSRGGFGSTVAAKSSWGGSKSKSSWGG